VTELAFPRLALPDDQIESLSDMKQAIFNAKNRLIRPRSLHAYKHGLKAQTLKPDELEDLQLEKLRRLFSHAKSTSSFYQRKYEGIETEDIKNVSDWQAVPVLEKDEIRANASDFIEDEALKRFGTKVTTGGSTGVPLEVYHDRRFPTDVLGWRTLSWWGLNISCDVAFIYRLVRQGWKARLNDAIWFPTRRIFLDASLMTRDSMLRFARELKSLGPPLLQGYVGGVYEFAKFCEDHDIVLDFLRAVWVTSAPIAEPQRAYLESVFRCPVYDQYGCSEIFWLAAECGQRKGLHTMADARYIEILDDEHHQVDTGEYGDIAVTDLQNYLFPLIRYLNGDRGRYLPGDCSCGVTFPRLDKIKGRVSDVVRLPDGGVISGEFLTTVFDDTPATVKAFQIHQHQDFSVDLVCVLGTNGDAVAVCEGKVQSLRELAHSKIDVRLRVVDEISHDRGKTRFIISDLD